MQLSTKVTKKHEKMQTHSPVNSMQNTCNLPTYFVPFVFFVDRKVRRYESSVP